MKKKRNKPFKNGEITLREIRKAVNADKPIFRRKRKQKSWLLQKENSKEKRKKKQKGNKKGVNNGTNLL